MGTTPVGGVDAAALESCIAELKTAGYAPNTTVGRVSAISAFYRGCVRELLMARNPVELIRRPPRPAESSTASLTRHQLTDWLAAAEHIVSSVVQHVGDPVREVLVHQQLHPAAVSGISRSLV